MNKMTKKFKYFLWKLTMKAGFSLAKGNPYVFEHINKDNEASKAMILEAKEKARKQRNAQYQRSEISKLANAVDLPQLPAGVKDVTRYVSDLSGINTSTKFLAELFAKAQASCEDTHKAQKLSFVMPVVIKNGKYDKCKKWEIAYRVFSQKRWKLLKTVPMQNLESSEAILEFCSLMDSLGYTTTGDPVIAFESFIENIFKPAVAEIKAYSAKNNLTVRSDFVVKFQTGYESENIYTNPKIEVVFSTNISHVVSPLVLSFMFSRPKPINEAVN